MKDKLIIPGTIILASIILGSFYYATQINKQKSIERQQQLKLEEERNAEEARLTKEKEEIEKQAAKNKAKKLLLESCLSDAEEEYINYAELNGKKNDDGIVWATNEVWDRAEKNRKEAKEDCFRKYPQ